MAGRGGQALKKGFRRSRLFLKQLVENPQHAVVLDLLHGRELPEPSVSGKENPVVDLGQRDRECVGQR